MRWRIFAGLRWAASTALVVLQLACGVEEANPVGSRPLRRCCTASAGLVIKPTDGVAIQSLYWLAGDPSQYRAVTARPTLVDGITDHDAKVVAVLHGVNRNNPLMRGRFNLSLRGAQRRGNLAEAEHTSTNRSRYGNEIANPRIEYGVAMTKWVRESPICLLTERSTVVVDWPVNRGTHAQPGGKVQVPIQLPCRPRNPNL